MHHIETGKRPFHSINRKCLTIVRQHQDGYLICEVNEYFAKDDESVMDLQCGLHDKLGPLLLEPLLDDASEHWTLTGHYKPLRLPSDIHKLHTS